MRALPHATLHLYYGWRTHELMHPTSAWRDEMRALIASHGASVVDHGRVLARHCLVLEQTVATCGLVAAEEVGHFLPHLQHLRESKIPPISGSTACPKEICPVLLTRPWPRR